MKKLATTISLLAAGSVAAAPLVSPADSSEGWWSPANAMTICASVLVFGLFAMGLTAYLSTKNQTHGEEFNKFNMVVLIVIASIFLVTAGYSDQQITPVIGLLGTIVGYVLGKNK